MGNVRIVTDSNAFLPPDLQEKYAIEVIPHRIKIGGAFYDEGADFTADDLFDKLGETQASGLDRLPEIMPADVNMILDYYTGPTNDAEEIVSVHMSGELSPMWKQARRASEMLRGRHTIRVFDSMSTSYGLGLLVEMAAEAAERGASVHEIARIVNGAAPHLYMAVFAESLHYLERSTQLGASQSILGSMLGIKAMLMMEEGKLMPLEKVQTREEAVEKLHEFVVEFATVERIGVMHHAYAQHSELLIEQLRETLPHVPIVKLPYPPSLAIHIGPNMLGVMVYEGMY
ncbi:MAG: DegV family protein [Caldilineaceae bacterium]|nr:DegV family protein [Caldilineaceae bacterium]